MLYFISFSSYNDLWETEFDCLFISRLGINGVITRVKDLFKGQQDLLLGLNTFLPKGFKITLDDNKIPPKKSVTYDDAIIYVNKVQVNALSQSKTYGEKFRLQFYFSCFFYFDSFIKTLKPNILIY